MLRRGGPRLLGVMATTAVVAGTPGRVSHRQQQRYAAEAAASAPQAAPMQAAPPAQPEYTPAQPDYLAEIQQLASLQQAGLITAEEFEAKKRQLLGI